MLVVIEVYDVWTYSQQYEALGFNLQRRTEDTIRISVVSPALFGIDKQQKDILQWAVRHRLFK